jgi:tetratricopeptide (TPR) repeat protein
VPAFDRRLNWIARAAPPLAIAALYAVTVSYGLIWDDVVFSAKAVYARCDLRAILLSPANGIEYLPIRDLTLCYDHAAFGDWGGGFHVTNVLIFMGTSVWIHSLYRIWFAASPNPRVSGKAPILALLAVLLLIVHPLQAEPVSFVTCRNALLAQLFLVGSLLAYASSLSSGRRLLYAASILLVPMALLSKATAAPLPVLLLLAHLYLKREDGLFRALKRVAPHFGIAIPIAALHLFIASQAAVHAKISLARTVSQLPMAGFVPHFYLYKFFWPFDLSVEYVLHGLRADLPTFATVTAFVLAAGAGYALIRHKTRSLGCFLCLALLAALAPILNLFPTVPKVADRYAQIPILFLAPLVTATLLSRMPARRGALVAAPLIAGLALLSHSQIGLWKSENRLFEHAAQSHPRAGLSLERLGYALWKQGRDAEAIDAFRRLAELDPREERHLLYGGLSALRRGDIEAADALMSRVEGKRPRNHLVYVILGDYYATREEYARAIDYSESARADAELVAPRDANARMIVETTGEKLSRLRSRIRD